MRKKTILYTLLLAITIAGVFIWYLNSQNPKDEYAEEIAIADKANTYYEKAVYDSAAKYFHFAGCTAFEHKHYDTAFHYNQRALQILYSCLDTTTVESKEFLAEAYLYQGRVLYRKSDFKNAQKAINAGYNAFWQVKEIDDSRLNNVHLAEFYYEFGLLRYNSEELSVAISLFDTVIMLLSDSTAMNYQKQVGLSFFANGAIYRMLGNYDKSLESYQIAYNILSRYYDVHSSYIISTLFGLGSAYRNKGLYKEALFYYDKIEKLIIDSKNVDDRLIMLYHTIATVHSKKEEYYEALKYYNKSIDLTIRLKGEDHQLLALKYNNKAYIYCELKNYPKSLDLHDKAIKIRKNVYWEKPFQVARS